MTGDIIRLIALGCFVAAFFIKKQIKQNTKVDGPLTKDEKTKVILTEFFSPILAGAVYYYGLRKEFPIKAKQANKYSIIIFVCQLLVGVGLLSLSV